ncbi:MFS transporter, CP family, cyanate transporter [Thermomonospora echinospora]|uniref:MFS transporter, CP family, cyanate transporter n=1 Tax=Thermomonospora echinospora TaxID=1992 RepID=A0A1H6D737_9ACTN|nr:MFS transporter [Thermomonospora echinospora]SEG80884.1 MFS transporter, CP family, cyanate transporter [Thermomonospora echinospora]
MGNRRAVVSVALIVLAALNLRPAVATVGPLLTAITGDLDLSGPAAGALTTLPLLCFGAVGLAAPALRGRVGEEPLLAAGMGLLVAGLLLRAGPVPATLFAGSLVVGLAIGVGNVVMPALIKREHPGSVTLVTSLYSTALTVGAAVSAAVVVPLDQALAGGWRVPLALLAVPAALALLGWLPRALRRPAPSDGPGAARRAAAPGLWRDRLAWQVSAFMGLQSLLAYVVFGWLPTLGQDRGMSEADAGLLLAVTSIVQAAGSLAVPVADRRLPDQRAQVVTVVALTFAGFAALVWAPLGFVWAAAVVLGLGQGALFALALSFLGLRAGDAATAARLSAMAQGTGYLIAATGPFAVGALYDLTGGWNAPIAFVLAITVIQVFPGLAAARDRTVG